MEARILTSCTWRHVAWDHGYSLIEPKRGGKKTIFLLWASWSKRSHKLLYFYYYAGQSEKKIVLLLQSRKGLRYSHISFLSWMWMGLFHLIVIPVGKQMVRQHTKNYNNLCGMLLRHELRLQTHKAWNFMEMNHIIDPLASMCSSKLPKWINRSAQLICTSWPSGSDLWDVSSHQLLLFKDWN